MNITAHPAAGRRRHLTVAAMTLGALAVAACVAAVSAPASGSTSPSTDGRAFVRVIHLVAHEQHGVFIDQGPHGPSLGDESVFAGIVNNGSDSRRVGSFGGTLTSITTDDSVFAATIDLRLSGGQLAIQGIFDPAASPIVHAITGGTGRYLGARGQFSFTEPRHGLLDITLRLLPPDSR